MTTWPPDRFYWALLDGSGWSRPGPLPPGLAPVFADEVPAPVEDFHIVCVPTGDGRLLACAARRTELEALDAQVLVLTPASLPDFAPPDVDPSSLELLVGDFEPRAVRSAHNLRHVLTLGTLLTCTALLSFGFHRREQIWERQRRNLQTVCSELAAVVAPGVPPELLASELQHLRQRQVADALKPPRDAGLAAAALLKSWPAQVPSRPQGLSVSQSSISVSVVLDREPSEFLSAISAPPGWKLEEPRINATGDAWHVNLAFMPEGPHR